jgi:hypothetical protein
MHPMPHGNDERVVNTFIGRSGYGGLLHGDEAEQRGGRDIEHA